MKVAIVAGIVLPHDAISAAVAAQAEVVATIPGVESVVVFANHIRRPLSCVGHVITNPWQLIRHVDFVGADIVIFHWGIHYDLFDAVTLSSAVGQRHAVVHFHNCTPQALMAEADRELIERSLVQIQHAIGLGLRFWTFSEFNRLTLLEWGVDPARLAFVPFPIDLPRFDPRARSHGRVEMLAVGRRVQSKGLHVLLEALVLLPADVLLAIHVRIAGSSYFSDPSYVAMLIDVIEGGGLQATVEFVEEPTDDELWELYRTSDVVVSTSFHEGLCIPIVEGYAFGCRAIGTTAGNLQYIVQDPDPRVEPGNAVALAAAIKHMVIEIAAEPMRTRLHPALVDQYSAASSRAAVQRELFDLAGRD